MAGSRDYAALPHEYLEEMEALSDAAFGRLMRALIRYSRDGAPIDVRGSERFYAVRVMAREDRYQQSYRRQSESRREHALIAAEARWNRDAQACSSMPEDARHANTETETETETKTETEVETGESTRPRPHGAYGWVMLTQAQHDALLRELGSEELARCIAYVDESAQATGNRNRWRDWALILRKCSREGWGLQQQTARLEREAECARRREIDEGPSLEELNRILQRI